MEEYEWIRVCGQCGGTPCPLGCQTPGWQRYQAPESVRLRRQRACRRCYKTSREWTVVEINGCKGVCCMTCLHIISKVKHHLVTFYPSLLSGHRSLCRCARDLRHPHRRHPWANSRRHCSRRDDAVEPSSFRPMRRVPTCRYSTVSWPWALGEERAPLATRTRKDERALGTLQSTAGRAPAPAWPPVEGV
jgi:hypothetical protein